MKAPRLPYSPVNIIGLEPPSEGHDTLKNGLDQWWGRGGVACRMHFFGFLRHWSAVSRAAAVMILLRVMRPCGEFKERIELPCWKNYVIACTPVETSGIKSISRYRKAKSGS